MVDLYIIDCLFGIYNQPLKREDNLIGLTVYSQVFRENEYKKSSLILNEWLQANRSVGGTYLFEFARGPYNCFEFLYSDFKDLFDSGSVLSWAGSPDTPNPKDWIVPAETISLIDDRGLPLSQADLIARL